MYDYSRLKKNVDFKNVYQTGKSFSTRYTVLYIKPNYHNKIRVGFSISKKIGNSVTRNRIRRLYKEALLQHKKNLIIGYDIVLIARRSAAGLIFDDAVKDINILLKKAKIFKREEE